MEAAEVTPRFGTSQNTLGFLNNFLTFLGYIRYKDRRLLNDVDGG
jgi:hypothetical protein